MARVSYICGTCRSYNRHTGACDSCGRLPDFARPPSEAFQVGMIDGEHSGYYHPDTGFPVDPKNPNKRICPARGKARDAFSRLHDRTQGGVSYE